MEHAEKPVSLPGRAVGEIVQDQTDFDRSEPRALLITGFGAATLIGLVAVMLGIQAYFDHIREVATYEKVLAPVSSDLRALHSQEDGLLNSYKYVDRQRGVVQIPISRAMNLIVQEAAANKLKYFRKPTPVKSPDATGPAGGAGNAAPAGPPGSPGAPGSSLGAGKEPGSTGNTKTTN
jgi:hypothetical protein